VIHANYSVYNIFSTKVHRERVKIVTYVSGRCIAGLHITNIFENVKSCNAPLSARVARVSATYNAHFDRTQSHQFAEGGTITAVFF
jgi:hypothetical protein